MERCGYLATLISLSIGAENSDLRNTRHSEPQNRGYTILNFLEIVSNKVMQ